MTRNPLNGSALVAVAALAALLAACNSLLDVKVPDRVPAELLDDPKQAGLMVNSAIGDFECALGSAIVVEGIISDELADAQLGAQPATPTRTPRNRAGTAGCPVWPT